MYGESGYAINKLYQLKGRGKEKATQLLIGDISWLKRYTQNIPHAIMPLLLQYWPGPLTVILPASLDVPKILLGEGDTIGIRIPAHQVALEILRQFGKAIAASSANPSGLPPARNIEEIKQYFSYNVLIVDGKPSPSGISSTIIDAAMFPPKIIREGAISKEDITKLLLV